jgi:DNA-binding NtrC family response regulator
MIADKLLLVDDEPSLLRLLERYLSRLGFDVDGTSTGAEAWEHFESSSDSYRLIILDLGLPDVPGEQLLAKLRSKRPDIPAILCSGTLPPSSVELSGKTLFLQKPFLPHMLKESVAKALAD